MAWAHVCATGLLPKRDKNSYSHEDICSATRTDTFAVMVATYGCEGIHAARPTLMTDFLTLLQRDHHDLECGLDELLQATTVVQIRSALDGVRLCLTAHAEAEDIVLHGALATAGSPAPLEDLVGQARSLHLAEEGALASLVCARPGTQTWRDRARSLRDLVHEHAAYEERKVAPAFRELAPRLYRGLAGQFATERLRQLALLQPSTPLVTPAVARAS